MEYALVQRWNFLPLYVKGKTQGELGLLPEIVRQAEKIKGLRLRLSVAISPSLGGTPQALNGIGISAAMELFAIVRERKDAR